MCPPLEVPPPCKFRAAGWLRRGLARGSSGRPMADVDEEALVDAVRAALVDKPGMGIKPLVKHLTANGWTVDSRVVRNAIDAIASSKYVPAGRAGEAAMARAEDAAAKAEVVAAAKKAALPAAPTSLAHDQRLKDIVS